MSDCLSKEELELLNKRELRGAGLVKALKHLETCEKCRLQIELPTKKEILGRIFDEDEISAMRLSEPLPQQKK